MFYTKRNLPKRVNRVYSRVDKVDRVSYLDTNQQIRAFMSAGANLAVARARALQGFYGDDVEYNDDDSDTAVPIYPLDPSIAKEMYKSFSEKLNASIAVKSEGNGDTSATVKQSDNSEESEAVKSAVDLQDKA